MGIDLNRLFGGAGDAVKKTANQLLDQGWNAGLGYLEGEAADIISADRAQHEANFQKAIQDTLNSPSSPGGFSAYLSNLVQGPALKTYGAPILILVVAVLAGGYFMGRK